MNVELMFSSKTDLWSTPQKFFDELNKEFNFSLDVCANYDNKKCEIYYDEEANGLCRNWDAFSVWCNPPYGRTIGKWVEKSIYRPKKI